MKILEKPPPPKRQHSHASTPKNSLLMLKQLTTKMNQDCCEPCQFIFMKDSHLKTFVSDKQRTFDALTETLSKLLPFYGEITKLKRKNILNSFEEVQYYGGGDSTKPSTIMEYEGKMPQYVYLILRGSIYIYKKIPGLYTEEEQLVKLPQNKTLDKFQHPAESGA